MIKGFVRNVAKRYGYEILGPRSAYAAQRSLVGLLQQEGINLILDVGANTGQFADEMRALGYKNRIVSYEPLASAHSLLCSKAKMTSNWSIAARTAIGAEAGSVEIHVSGNSVSSSILEMLPTHSQAAPLSTYVGSELVPVSRLDDICDLTSDDRVLLKIDVQGYEKQVVEGASHVLRSCRAVISEMSLLPLYEGQVLAKDMWGLLEGSGFEPWSLEPGFRHPNSGRLLQIDGVFVRRGGALPK